MRGSLYHAIRSNLAGSQNRRVRGRSVSRFSGVNPNSAATNLNTSVQSVNAPLAPVSLMNTGNKSPFNANAPMHHNLVRLKITNNDSSNPANVILSAGRHNFQAPQANAGITLSDQLISDGANTLTNNAGDSVSVSVSCEYGFRSNATSAWAEILSYAKDYGFIVGALRADFNTQTQQSNAFVFQKYDLFGQDVFDKVVPSNYYDPNQYHDKTLMIKEGFALTQDMILYYTIDPAESVVLHFYLSAIFDVQSAAIQHARQMNQYAI